MFYFIFSQYWVFLPFFLSLFSFISPFFFSLSFFLYFSDSMTEMECKTKRAQKALALRPWLPATSLPASPILSLDSSQIPQTYSGPSQVYRRSDQHPSRITEGGTEARAVGTVRKCGWEQNDEGQIRGGEGGREGGRSGG